MLGVHRPIAPAARGSLDDACETVALAMFRRLGKRDFDTIAPHEWVRWARERFAEADVADHNKLGQRSEHSIEGALEARDDVVARRVDASQKEMPFLHDENDE